tara:strand:- start:41 stop:1534 length:1494 start_codon:yes stop_codon:yes gene_type:complete
MSEVKVNKITPRTDCGTTQLGDSGDTVTVAGDLKSNSLKATDGGVIISQSGTNITIGASGDTVSLASGASQSGFGRSGAVDWQTGDIKTSNFTAVNGQGFFINSAGGSITVTLPSSPSAGNIVAISDYNSTASTNNITIARNGSNINGSASNLTVSKPNSAIELVYVDATTGWQSVATASTSDLSNPFLSATGGTVTTSGDYKIHTFTGPGTFTVSKVADEAANNVVDYLVVAGGGSGPATGGGDGISGGGGAGGFRFFASPSTNPQSGNPGAPRNAPAGITVTATGFPITVGGGGPAGTGSSGFANGNPSTFSTITSAGGGRGGRGDPDADGKNGGSGGGADNNSSGGTGNTPPVSPVQGTDGGDASLQTGGGGGGAMAAGADGTGGPGSGVSGNGGAGAGITGFGSSNGQCSSCVQFFSGGGGGGNGNGNFPSPGTVGTGGIGGGAAGKNPSCTGASNGTANTGGGGGGASDKNPGGGAGGAGGSGIVVIRYKYQ